MNNSIEEFLEVMQKDITVTTIEENGARMLIPAKVNKIPTNIIINRFSMFQSTRPHGRRLLKNSFH